ncbi:protein S100-A6-like [Heterodontus francisci]|uniref:protein S100-A6-like n=1 Tax=Heterodontus francisci TaxID=7792 RepID=UPI00355C01E6
MCSLKSHVEAINSVFVKYASQKGNKDTLDEDELKDLFQKELTDFSIDEYAKLAKDIIQIDSNDEIDRLEFFTILECLVLHRYPKQQCARR